MKSLLLSVLAVLSISAPALAGDEISVVVNGRTYSCGEGGGTQYKYYCQCETEWNSRVRLSYYRANVQTGKSEFVQELTGGGGNHDWCEEVLKKHALCRSGRH